jgi:hypothetical protein
MPPNPQPMSSEETQVQQRALLKLNRFEQKIIEHHLEGHRIAKTAFLFGTDYLKVEGIIEKYQEIFETEMRFYRLEVENQRLKTVDEDRMRLRDELLESRAREYKANNRWESMGVTGKIITALLVLIFLKALISPVTHRLSPDVGTADHEGDVAGQVIGFHYEKRTWWGWRKKTYDSIRFRETGPEYLDGEQWKSVPAEAWGSRSGSDGDEYQPVEHYR